jgi:hypothetical protein
MSEPLRIQGGRRNRKEIAAMPGPSNPAEVPEKKVAEVFNLMVNDLLTSMAKEKHEFAVDIEITFQSVTVDERGFPLFSKKTSQSQMQIKLATRITPQPGRKKA